MKKLSLLLPMLGILFIANNAQAQNHDTFLVTKNDATLEASSNKDILKNVLKVDKIWKIYNNNDFMDNLFLVEENTKYGLMNDKTEMVLPIKFDFIFNSFTDDNLIVKDKTNFFLVNIEGKTILQDNFKSLGFADKNLYFFSKNSKDYGIIDSTGKIIIEPKFQELKILDQENHYYTAKMNGKYGVIDNKGNFLVNPNFKNITSFSEDMVIFQDKKYGVADKNGKVILEPKHDLILGFKDGISHVKEDNGKGFFIDKAGKTLFSSEFNYPMNFLNDITVITKDKKYGLMDKTGKVLVEPKFDYILQSENKTYTVRINHKYGLMDSTGKMLLEPNFAYIDLFTKNSNTLFSVDKKPRKYGLIDGTGKVVLEPKYDEIIYMYSNFSTVRLNGKYGAIDKDGKEIIAPKYDSLELFSNLGISPSDSSVMSVNGKYGVISTKDEVLLEPKYDEVTILSNNAFLVRENESYFFVNKKLGIFKETKGKYKKFKLEQSTKTNMHYLQTLLETFAVDHKGLYPKDIKELIKEAEKGHYYKKLVNFEDAKLEALADNKSDLKGVVIYQPIIDKDGKIRKYNIFANDKTGKILKDKLNKPFYLRNW